ncbi:zinc finger protein 438-like [Polyodon spathula]|uniref:zinc finger protein 438-like n=1 Tax=Polyodon spathula TaxID=7913 RepID=UPI001B7E04D8|nr:zinc finger protein 438-like [Polyodon spathula]XP_041099885.1 zinc finger protein 438-like [Polyodon spathula]XP_041099886.1 zinc finger protein 438-like [Polyodon spathula]
MACPTKSLQFRTIAPKAPSSVVGPAILSCQPSLPDAQATSPKSIIMPAQKYALMQVASQEGTFSLVALSPPVTPQSPQQIQRNMTFPRNMKLPIPRYQSVRHKSTPEKATAAAQRAHMFTPAKHVTQAVQMQTPASPAETPCKVEGSEQVILIDPSSSEISVTTLLTGRSVLGSSVEKPADTDKAARDPTICSVSQHLHVGANAAEPNSSTYLKESEDKAEKLKQDLSKPSNSSNTITVLSPAIFGKAVQIIPSAPKVKVPILPYSKVKNTLYPVTKLNLKSPEKTTSISKSNLLKTAEHTPLHLEASDGCYLASSPSQGTSQQTNTKCFASNFGKVLADTFQKPTTGTIRKRGRKRKTIEDVLVSEAKKKRSFSFIKRQFPDKPLPDICGSKEEALDICKKYRSIRPKPVVLAEALPHVTGLNQLPECLEHDFLINHRFAGRVLDCQHLENITDKYKSTKASNVYLGSKQLHRCPTCNRCFQFKHHLQSHMNSHTNSRPYVCPLCRKTYAHSGSLSTHMKLHHSEGRHKKNMRCEFCNKVFGYIGVYFRHLKEVHKVILSLEPSVQQNQVEVDTASGGSNSTYSSDDPIQSEEEQVELQIKCGRCQTITPTFADMKLHLLYVHGEEIQVRLKDKVLQGGREAENELVKHAAHYWKQLNEKRNLVKCGSCKEEFYSFSKLRKHIYSHHQGESAMKVDSACSQAASENTCRDHALNTSPELLDKSITLRAELGFNCILCTGVLASKEEMFDHWQSRHNCEDPAVLWTVVSAFMEREEVNPSSENPEQQSAYHPTHPCGLG